jgi:hypothetical protein
VTQAVQVAYTGYTSVVCAVTPGFKPAGQSYGELNTLETNVEASLASGEGDAEYWTAVLQRLQIYRVSQQVHAVHAMSMAG